MNTDRKKQIRFKPEDDLRLLREVVGSNPLRNKNKWAEIAEPLSTSTFILDSRRVRERTNLLIEQHKRETREHLKRSGVDEDVSEKTNLLDDVIELKNEEEREKKEEKEKKDRSENLGKEIRKRALECLTPKKNDECDLPVLKKKNSQTYLVDYLKEKSENEISMRKSEMEVRKEELKLEKAKFEMEREERMQRMEIEKQEKLAFIDLLKKLTKDN
ncbi:uncharacterized protein LOC130051676 [Ostrea edulis]|uniref:uncharacterized protein LOC130051676 n=1 Tax=Ostrea edulis TaxID=37623 RepID=UPI0024AF8B01|nr:uncharacterized protein LOC130051676 [Ostrea edulis]